MSTFTAHNVLLSTGEQTLPTLGWFIADSPWYLSAGRVLKLLYGGRTAGRSIVDLGCLEGGYTLEFAKLGFNAVGVEVRQSNIDNCEIIAKDYGQPNLTFHKSDVWNLPSIGTFDAAFCCGLLYHLDKPAQFLRMLSEQVRDVLIINTHVALERDGQPQMSGMTVHEGMKGRWYAEYDPAQMTPEILESAKWTSWENSRSFWPTLPALTQLLLDLGYDLVFEQTDWLAPDVEASMAGSLYDNGRRMVVAIRTGGLARY